MKFDERDEEMDTLTSRYDSLGNSSQVKCWVFRRRWQRNTGEANNFSYQECKKNTLWVSINEQSLNGTLELSSQAKLRLHPCFQPSFGYLQIYNASTASSIFGAASNLRYEKAMRIIKKTYRIMTRASHQWGKSFPSKFTTKQKEKIGG